MDKKENSYISCPNCSKSFIVSASNLYAECFHCHTLFGVKTSGNQTELVIVDDYLQPILEKLKNLDYLIWNKQNEIKRLEKEIRLLRIFKYLSILFIVMDISLSIYKNQTLNQVNFLIFGSGLLLLLITISGSLYDRKKVEKEKKELTTFQNEKHHLEEQLT